MYKVVSGALTILFAISLILSFLGVIAYTPLAMTVSLLVLGVSVWLTSVLFGMIFGTRIHHESSFITALILFFIFTPTLDSTKLVGLLLVGMIAGASKFIITYKGRHIFNAAAIAAFIAGVFNISHASWWVGTPVLILPTLLLGYAILQKTRRVSMSAVFVLLASAIVITLLIAEGATIGEAMLLWLSWPILFFASFMLTEPLTLPEKKWQQIVEAVIVALVFAIPFTINDFSSSPALALILGNLVAFALTRRRKILLTFKHKKQLTPTTYEFVFTPNKPIIYEPGQYIEIQVPAKRDDFRGSRRSFSLTSVPKDNTVTLGIKFYEPSSTFKQALRLLKSGAVVTSTGIGGDFTLPINNGQPILFVAGGIGVTPFIGQLRSLAKTHHTRDIILVYSVSTIDEVAYKDVLRDAGIKVYIITKSSKKVVLPRGWTHINEPYVTEAILRDISSDLSNRTAYISGPPALVDGAKKQLMRIGVKRIKTDYFIGY